MLSNTPNIGHGFETSSLEGLIKGIVGLFYCVSIIETTAPVIEI
jgi:hypothetical protein